MKNILYILLVWLGSYCNLLAQSPVIDSQPADKLVECHQQGVIDSLSIWYENSGGMEVSDVSGEVTIEGEFTLSEVIDMFNMSLGTLCGRNQKVTLRFVAENNEGQTTTSELATFSYSDIKRPTISTQASTPFISCDEMTRDSFINWIQGHGNAVASDVCGDVTWTSFIWNDSDGNIGTSSIANGPYPVFLGECTYFYKVSFIVEDECGNETASAGRFDVVDATAPVFDTLAADITVDCNQIPEPIDIELIDYCDPNPTLSVLDESGQSSDSTSCDYYNYQILRSYKAVDGCGNENIHVQTIKVVDNYSAIIDAETIVTISCAEYSKDSIYAHFEGGCNDFTLAIQDSIAVENSCETTINRFYYLNDICDNRDTFEQKIIVVDKDGPMFSEEVLGMDVYCNDIDNITEVFDQWISQVLSQDITDDCNDVNIRATVPGSFDINNLDSFPGITPVFSVGSLCNTTIENVALRQQVDFVLFDSCGNVNNYVREFRILDSIPPTITNCPEEVEIGGNSGSCTSNVKITLPEFNDKCVDEFTTDNSLTLSILLDDVKIELDTISNNLYINNVTQGTHVITYLVSDCAGNTTQCTLEFTIEDEVSPFIIECPTDTTVAISTGCEVVYDLPMDITVEDNCFLDQSHFYMIPASGGTELLKYTVTDGDTTILNKGYVFDNIEPVYFNTSPAMVTLFIAGPEGMTFSIFGEMDVFLGNGMISNGCEGESFAFEISGDMLIEWLDDERIELALVPGDNNVSPCASLIGETDGITRASVSLSYSDAQITYEVSGSTMSSSEQILYDDSTIELNVGDNFITYYVADQADNRDSCTFKVLVTETQAPEAICKNVLINTIPDVDNKYTLDVAMINNGSTDDCGIDTMYLSENTFDCSSNGEEIEVTLYVVDNSGNVDSCTSRVRIESMELTPSYSSGICEADTLRLFANIPTGQNSELYTYEWTGPQGYMSSQENPIILDASSDNNGIYYLTITGFGGCSSTGSVQVSSESLATPMITSERDTLCSGDNLILTTTVYSGQITYEWYEGVAPNGILISTTEVPTTLLNPTAGTHTYYVIAFSPTCESNSSSILEVLALEPPIAMVNHPFINICEGQDFNLGTVSSGNDYAYQWSGPNGFSSSLPNPPTILNASLSDGGQYLLLINVGGCTSDTAISRVNVFETPATPVITSNDVFCEGSTITFSINNIGGGDTYYWYLDGVLFTTTIENSLNIDNATTNLQGEWTVQIEEGICLSEFSTAKEIVVSNLGDVTATNTGPGCVGDSIQLFSTFLNNATYEWTGPDGFISDVQNPKILAIAGEYTVNVSTSINCIISGSTTVTVSSAPTITALSSNAEDCMSSDDEIQFFPTITPDNSNYTYSWTGPDGFISDVKNPTLSDLTEEMVGTYILTVYKDGCASNEFMVEVAYKLIPTVGDIELAGIGCIGDDITLTTNAIEGFTYVWVTPSGEYSTDTSSLTITNIMLSDEGNYSVALVNDECRGSNSEPILIEIGEVPDTPEIVDNSPLCPGDSLRLAIFGSSENTYRWKVGDNILGQGNTFVLGDITEDILSMISVEVSDGSCSSGFYPVENLSIGNALTTPIGENDFYEYCSVGLTTIEICVTLETVVNNATYTLYNSNDQVIAMSDTPCITIDAVDNLEVGINNLYIQASRGTCLSEGSEYIRILLSEPGDFDAKVLSEDKTICEESSLLFISERSEGETDIRWYSPDSELIFSSEDERMTRVSNFKEGENIVILSYSAGICIDYSTDTIIVTYLEGIITRDDEYTVNSGDILEFDMTDNDDTNSTNEVRIISGPNLGDLEETSDGYSYMSPENYNGEVTILYEVCNTVCDICSESTITIDIQGTEQDDCIVPTIITPNDDGINDHFIVPCLTGGTYVGSILTVFNEWGSEVYRSEDYRNDWAGTFHGELLPVGTYFYVLQVSDDRKPINGFLIIQR